MRRNWEDLANAIVSQAVTDYRTARIMGRVFRYRETSRAIIREVEHFFRSRWFNQLTDIDGKALIRNLREEDVWTFKNT